jgi:hypothetical protein
MISFPETARAGAIPPVDDELIAGSLRDGLRELDRAASNSGVSTMLPEPQFVVFPRRSLDAGSNHSTAQPSIKGQPA